MIDLHTHSTASDGSLAPAALLDRAAALGLAGLALTDHDTLAGLAPARIRAEFHGIRFLAGIELSSNWRGACDVHILGYGVESASAAPLAETCRRLRAARAERAAQILDHLHASGVPLPFEAVLAEAGDASLGRPHIARALVAAGFASDLKQAFECFLAPGAPAFVAHHCLDAAAAVRLLRASGAVAVLAHPGTLTLAESQLADLLRELISAGLTGVEAFWSQHSPAQASAFSELAVRHRLLAIGGSDFHGANKPEIELGMASSPEPLPLDLMDALVSLPAPAS